MPRFHTFEDLEAFLSTTGPKMAQDTLKSATASREERSAATGVVAAKITEKWGDGLACLDAVTFAMGQNGLMMLKRLDEIDESQPDDPHQTVRVVLALQQFNALLVLQEIGVLLGAGFWSGAAARWRALHEAAVTARIIAAHGPFLAQRYLDHGFVVQTRRLKLYFDEHGVGPVSLDELGARAARAVNTERSTSRWSTPRAAASCRELPCAAPGDAAP